MNILIITLSFPSYKDGNFDGKFVLSEAFAYAENGANVRVLTPHYNNAEKIEQFHERINVFRFQYFAPKAFQVLKKPGVPVYSLRSPLAVFQVPFLCFFFVLHILKHAPWSNVIHAQWTFSGLLALAAKWIYGKKIVVTARGSDLRLLPRWMNQFIHYKVDAAIDCFGPQPWNVEYKKTFRSHYLKLPLIVHNEDSLSIPEDMKVALSKKSDPFIILYVGRFSYAKMQGNKLPLIGLIHAARILESKDIPFHLLYIGEGEISIKREMLRLIDSYDLHQHVSLLGPKNNVSDYIKWCHIGVGGIAFNAVSQEFTVHGKTQLLIDSVDNAGTPWRHGINSIFVKPDDEIDLVEKLIWATENRQRAIEMGEYARNKMKEIIVGSKLGGKLYLREFEKLQNRST